jgi:putative FmdB family regulatory protein
MPIYEYHCEKCGHEFEVLQKHFDVDEVPCETCGGTAKRMISNTSFVLKGTGWYVTDYKKGGGSCPDSGSNGKSNGDKAAKTESTTTSCASAGAGAGCQSCSSGASTGSAASSAATGS